MNDRSFLLFTMKKRMWYILGILLIIVLMIWYSLSDFSVMNLIPRRNLPDKYNGYKDINDGISSAHYQSALLFNSDNETRLDGIPPLYNSDNHTVIISKQKEKDQTVTQTYLKLDANGTIIDSLAFINNWPIDYSGYLLTPKSYCSWMINGDKEMHNYLEQNTDLSETGEALNRHFKELYQKSSIVYYYYSYDLEDPRLQSLEADKVVFYQNGEWVSLIGKKLHNMESNGYKRKGLSIVTQMPNLIDNEHIDKPNRFAYVDYFQKQLFKKGRGPALGSPTGLSTSDRWEGTGYINLTLKQDTIRIKQEMIKDDNGSSSSPYNPYSFTFYFTNDNLNFGLFANNSTSVYIIKSK